MSALALKTWWFAPIYGDVHADRGAIRTGSGQGPPEHVHGFDLKHAFKSARALWPTANGWRCLGRVNARDPERSTAADEGWEVHVGEMHRVRLRP